MEKQRQDKLCSLWEMLKEVAHPTRGFSLQISKLGREESVNILAILDFLRRAGLKNGKEAQKLLSATSDSGLNIEALELLISKTHHTTSWKKNWDKSLKRAEATVSNNTVHIFKSNLKCPFLFGFLEEGVLQFPKVGILNSRVPRMVRFDEPWLEAFRHALKSMEGLEFLPVVSTGTLGYDLFRVWAEDNKRKSLRILPHPYAESEKKEGMSFSCCLHPFSCDRSTMMKCRDSMVALFSDLVVVVYLRQRSSLMEIIRDFLLNRRKPLFVWKGSLKEAFFGHLQAYDSLFAWEVPERVDQRKKSVKTESRVSILRPDDSFPAGEYLYHYTRSTYGPSPHESREDYLRRLLKGDQLASNTSVDILIRIAQEGCVKPHGAMIRDGTPVTSWTSLSPKDAKKIRRWNPASLRWTLGHCGIAVRRSILKGAGAKPVCYIASRFYERLPESERYRFQKHEPPRARWKAEREWRLKGGLDITRLVPGEAFWFFTEEQEAQKFASFVTTHLPIYLFETKEN